MPLFRFRYRAFLSKEQVNELLRPSPDTVELVSAWLLHNGIPSSSISMTHGGTWLTVSDLRVTQASQLLGASYQLYRNMKANETIIRTVGYSLPEVLHRHVQIVMPTTHFFSMEMTVQTPHRRIFGPAPAEAPAASGKPGTVQARQPPPEPPPEPPIVQPADLRWIYGTIEYQPIGYYPGQNSLAVVGIRLPREQELAEFMNEYRTSPGEAVTFVVGQMGGNPVVNLDEIPDEASTVAVQYSIAMAYPTPLTFYRISQQPPGDDPFLDFILFLSMEQQVLPQTLIISFSYFLEHTIPPGYARLLCQHFGMLGVRGVSVLVASGNDGVGPEGCYRGQFEVEFPSSCSCGTLSSLPKREYKSLTRPCFAGPWVTSVGGTQGINPERAMPRSGGGFSDIFDRPGYQEGAVEEYLYEFRYHFGNQYTGRYAYAPSRDLTLFLLSNLCSAFGRAYPDISAQAFGCRIFLDNADNVATGTSCAVGVCLSLLPSPLSVVYYQVSS